MGQTQVKQTEIEMPILSEMGFSKNAKMVWNVTLHHSGAFSTFLSIRISGNIFLAIGLVPNIVWFPASLPQDFTILGKV